MRMESMERPDTVASPDNLGSEVQQPVRIERVQQEFPPLSDITREKLEEKNFPQTIIDEIRNDTEGKVYADADIDPEKINGRDVLVRTDIDYNQRDPVTGETNLERMERGVPPLDSNGKPIELHHIGQRPDSPFAELTVNEHRGPGNSAALHPTRETSVHVPGSKFWQEKKEHWQERARQVNSQKMGV